MRLDDTRLHRWGNRLIKSPARCQLAGQIQRDISKPQWRTQPRNSKQPAFASNRNGGESSVRIWIRMRGIPGFGCLATRKTLGAPGLVRGKQALAAHEKRPPRVPENSRRPLICRRKEEGIRVHQAWKRKDASRRLVRIPFAIIVPDRIRFGRSLLLLG